MQSKPTLIPGDKHTDERGSLSFFNSFSMKPVKRFYCIEHPDAKVIRAWQGHQREQKWFCVVEGRFQMAIVHPDDWDQPSGKEIPESFVLSADDPKVLHVPGGFATGFRTLDEKAKMIVFSDATVEESEEDDYRFEINTWKVDWQGGKCLRSYRLTANL